MQMGLKTILIKIVLCKCYFKDIDITIKLLITQLFP